MALRVPDCTKEAVLLLRRQIEHAQLFYDPSIEQIVESISSTADVQHQKGTGITSSVRLLVNTVNPVEGILRYSGSASSDALATSSARAPLVSRDALGSPVAFPSRPIGPEYAPFDMIHEQFARPLTEDDLVNLRHVSVGDYLDRDRAGLKLPFLEETLSRLFTHCKRAFSLVDLWGISHWPDDLKDRFLLGRDQQQQSKFLVVSSVRISKVQNISVEWVRGIRTFYYDIEREDGSTLNISDHDFDWLRIRDVETIYNELNSWVVNRWMVEAALENIELYLKLKCRKAILDDFQIAMEANQVKINQLRPNLTHPHSAGHRILEVLSQPDPGIIYKNTDVKEWRLLRFKEIHLFSDGTLNHIVCSIDETLKKIVTDATIKDPEEREMWKVRKDELARAKKIIKERQDERLSIGRLKAKLGIQPNLW